MFLTKRKIMFKLLTIGNPKTLKTAPSFEQYMSIVLHLSPAKLSGKNFCPYSEIAGCENTCLNTAGRGGIFKKGEKTNPIQKARLRRSKLFNLAFSGFVIHFCHGPGFSEV